MQSHAPPSKLGGGDREQKLDSYFSNDASCSGGKPCHTGCDSHGMCRLMLLGFNLQGCSPPLPVVSNQIIL